MFRGTSASIRGKNNDPSELRIVLIGGRHGLKPCGKSSVGNIILGRDVFETNRRTSKSVMRQEKVSGRQVTVVDTPGWMSDHPLHLTPRLTQLGIKQSVYLCPPGPDAFVLVMPLDFTYLGTRMSVEEHLSFLLSDRVWKHTIVVFTVADENKMIPVEDLIRSDYNLTYLTKKCEERFHVLNITDRGDGSQVTELLAKIEQMVTSNGCQFEPEKHVSEELKKMERTIRRRAEQRTADARKQTQLPKHIGLTDLRILLFGENCSGKSSAGNTIMEGSVFIAAGQRSVHCQLRHGEVAGRHLTVVDSPGWLYNSELQYTSEMDKLEIQNSVRHCPPGPHAVLLIVRADEAFTKTHKVAVEEHMTLLSQSVWSHTLVLFTVGDWLGDTSIEQHIEAEGEDLSWLVDKCGNRYHVFNNETRDDTQVTKLLEKIEEMVAGNRGGHYEVHGDVSEKLSERKRNIEEHVQAFLTKTYRRKTALKSLFEGEHQTLPDVRVMLVGGDQLDRSRVGDLILQDNVFTEVLYKEFKNQTKLTECVRQQRRVAERNLSLVNCPDWSTTLPSQKIKDVLLHGVTLCSPGPHSVLLTVSVMSSFSEVHRRSVEDQMELLGDRAWRHALILFTEGWWLGERCVEEYIEFEGEPLRWLLEKCGYRYHVLPNGDISEVTDMVEKIEDLVTKNIGQFGLSASREDRSVRDTGHLRLGEETRQKTLFERKGKQTFTAEEWSRREEEWKKKEEEMIERMSKFVVTEPEEPTLPAVRRRRSLDLDHYPPSMSGGTPSETGSSYRASPAKVPDWLLMSPSGSIVSSSGYDTMSAPSQADTDGKVSSMKKMFERLKGKQTLTAEEWSRREEEWTKRVEKMIERMLRFVVTEPQEPTLPANRRHSIDIAHCPPSMSDGTVGKPPEAGSSSYNWSLAKVSDWLLKIHAGPIASSSGYDTVSEAPSQAGVRSVRDEDVSFY